MTSHSGFLHGDTGICQARDDDGLELVDFGLYLFAVKSPPNPIGDEQADPWVWVYKQRGPHRGQLITNMNPAFFAAHFLFRIVRGPGPHEAAHT